VLWTFAGSRFVRSAATSHHVPITAPAARIIIDSVMAATLPGYLVGAADTGAAADAVSAAGAASEFQVSRRIIHFPAFR
jgi:hypothetical protein